MPKFISMDRSCYATLIEERGVFGMIRLGIDIDGTVTDQSSLLPFLNKQFQMELTLKDIIDYDLTKAVGVSHEVFAKWFQDTEREMYKDSILAEGAKEILMRWVNSYELYFLSARPTSVLDVTLEWFHKHGVEYHHIECIGSHDKVNAAKHYKIDVFLEDKHDNAVDIHNKCQIPVLLFDAPYNRDPIPEGVIRIVNWQEADNWLASWEQLKLESNNR